METLNAKVQIEWRQLGEITERFWIHSSYKLIIKEIQKTHDSEFEILDLELNKWEGIKLTNIWLAKDCANCLIANEHTDFAK